MIGHSLGAHVIGAVGQGLKGNLHRLTGLDPAEVYYEAFPRRPRLSRDDAKFVDVIHTAGPWLTFDTPVSKKEYIHSL